MANFNRDDPSTWIVGSGTSAGVSDIVVILAQGTKVRSYISSIIIANNSASNGVVNIKDGAATKLVYPAPANSGAVHTLNPPLSLSINSPLQFASGSSISTMHVSALGYFGI